MREPVELAARDAVEQRRALDQFIARQREQPAFRRAVDGMSGATDALQEARDRARRAELADEIDVADIDAELERGGGDQRLELAALEPLLGVEPLLLGEAAVMRRDLLLAEPLGELAGRALGHAARVDEDERRAVLLDQLGEAVVDLLPDLGRHHRFERRGRDSSARSRARRWPVSMIVHPARRRLAAGADQKARDQPRSASASPTGRCAADGRRRAPSSRSSDSARCAPRLFGASAWISSTITVRVVESIARPDRSRAGCRAIPAWSRRCAAGGGACARARPPACRRCAPRCGSRHRAGPAPATPRGCRRAALRDSADVVRQRLQRRDVDDLGLVRQARSSPWRTRASIAARKAASVLPEPVGAAISTCRPSLGRRPASACAGVGRGEAAASNQSATAG